ncbi:inositol monophosphatase [Candidatus Fermentibacterales bacterium]|nr:inositol monophosphatase [Candidatus Fermentibacterales bacterium]
MSRSSSRDLLELMQSAAAEAAAVLIRSLGKSRPLPKAYRELVTDADLRSEELLRSRLQEALPGAGFAGEEDFGGSLPSGTYWLVDPLDGTNNYAHGYPVFSISIALIRNGVVELGCIHDPTRRETFLAGRGSGTMLNGHPVKASGASVLSDSLIATGFPYHRTVESLGFSLEPLVFFLHRAQGIRRGGSAALDLAYVASGRLDGFFEQHLRPWDMAAGVLAVTEAGGVVSSFPAGPWSVDCGSVVASCPGIAGAMLEGTSKATESSGLDPSRRCKD